MTADREQWLALKELFDEARRCDPAERPSFLQRVSREHPELYCELTALLDARNDGVGSGLCAGRTHVRATAKQRDRQRNDK